jgi:sugar phosphate isomerase/epimerase
MAITVSVFTDEVAPEFEEAVRQSVAAGATGLEIRGRLYGKSVTAITDDDVRRMQEVMARHGAHVAAIGSPFGKCDMDRPEELAEHQRHFERMLALARAFGTPIIRGFALWKPDREDERARPDLSHYLERIVAFLEPAVRLAEREGVFLCLENEPSTLVGTCAEARAVIDALGQPKSLAVAWDVNNGWYCDEPPLPDGYDLIRGWVRHLHVKPNPAHTMDTVAGSDLTYDAVFRALLADGYQGAASIEHWGSPEYMLQGVRELAATVARLEGAAGA